MRSPSPSKRCLPRAFAPSSRRPSSPWTLVARPRGLGAVTETVSPASAASIRRAARRIVSPSATLVQLLLPRRVAYIFGIFPGTCLERIGLFAPGVLGGLHGLLRHLAGDVPTALDGLVGGLHRLALDLVGHGPDALV